MANRTGHYGVRTERRVWVRAARAQWVGPGCLPLCSGVQEALVITAGAGSRVSRLAVGS